jgi:hypothetical protein
MRMANPLPRSAGVTAAATLAMLCCVSALILWSYSFLVIVNAPPNNSGRHLYEIFPFAFLTIALAPPMLIAFGFLTAIGLFRLRPWARIAAMTWASIALSFCLAMIAFRPFETFFFPDHFVSELQSFKQLVVISFLVMVMPISTWWLLMFRLPNVKLQFASVRSEDCPQEAAALEKS